MKITVLTLFPEMFEGFQTTSIIKKALLKQLVEFEVVDMRSFTQDKHYRVDDTPCGGGQGLVLMCQPVVDAIEAVRTPDSKVYLMSPQGAVFQQAMARKLETHAHLVLVCGHYEGFDERIRSYVDGEISIGDFVLTGGELAAMVISDAVIRLVEGVIREASHEDDSFEDGLLEYPQYTRPIDYRGESVPEVLLSGHHENIRKWRLEQSLRRTLQRRPDLLQHRELSKEEAKLMKGILEEQNSFKK